MSKIKKEQEPAYIFASLLIGFTITASWLKFRGFMTAEWDLILLPVGSFFVTVVAFEFVRKMQGLKGIKPPTSGRFDSIQYGGLVKPITDFADCEVSGDTNGGTVFEVLYLETERGTLNVHLNDFLVKTKNGDLYCFDQESYKQLFG